MALASMSARVSGGRVTFLPVGSPIKPVKSPMRNMTWCPSSWNWRILLMSTVWPRCRSGAVGSKPVLTRSGRPPPSFPASSSSISSSPQPRLMMRIAASIALLFIALHIWHTGNRLCYTCAGPKKPNWMNKYENRILTQFGSRRESKLRLRWIVTLCSLPFFGMVAAFGTAPDTAYSFIPTRTVVESLDVAHAEQSADADQVFWREERFARGDTISDLLARLGVNDQEARAFLDWIKRGRSLQLLRPGTTVQARTADNGSLLALRYITDKGRLIGFDKQGAEFKAVEQQLSLLPQQRMKSGEIRSSLFAAADAVGLSDHVAIQLADIFSGDIDFHRDLRRGDKFTVIYDMFYHEGRAIKSGRVLAAEFLNQGKSYRAIWFQDAEGKGGYYTPDGKNLRKAFLRSPLEFSRISSGFAMRFHPILHQWRAHKGIDYAAPVGTHVKATADGTVECVGRQKGD